LRLDNLFPPKGSFIEQNISCKFKFPYGKNVILSDIGVIIG